MIFAWIVENVSSQPLPVQFFYGIYRLISSIIDFFVSLIDGLCSILTSLGSGRGYLSNYLSWLPDEVFAVVGSIFVFVVLYKILGREG